MIKLFNRIDWLFNQIEDWTLFIAVSIAIVSAMSNVVMRKLTADFSIYWSDEVVRKVVYIATYVGCVAAIRSRLIVRIDALPQLVPALKIPLKLFSHSMVMVFSAIVIYLGAKMAWITWQEGYAVTTTLRMPEWCFYAVLPLMGVMMFIRTLIMMVEDWQGISSVGEEG